MLIILLFVLLIITIIVLASGFPLNFFLKSLLSFLILCISLILFFYTPVMILGFLHSPLDHTFTGELKTRDYQYLGEFKYWIPHGEGKKNIF
jgi:energy-coupling factor transporter transmembrane protein EcfT